MEEFETFFGHEKLMTELQEEWQANMEHHLKQHGKNRDGVRSSQISALVMLLMKKGVLKADE